MAPKPAEKTAAAKELKRKEFVDAPDEVAESEATKRSRVEKPRGAGDGKGLKIKQTGTAQLNKAQADRELDAERNKADTREQENARQRARTDERREQREADRRRQELEKRLQTEADETVRQAVQDTKTAAAAVIGKLVTSFMNTANTTVGDLATAAVQRRYAGGEQEMSRMAAERVVPEKVAASVEAEGVPDPGLDGDTHCRPKDTSRPHARGANTGGCGRAFTVENQAVDCYFDKCNKVKFCTDCKENQKRGMLVYLKNKQEWFCSERCVDTYNHEAKKENAQADRDDAAKKARMKEMQKKCACGKMFSEKNPDSGCARKGKCKRAHACYECVRSGRSTRGVSGKFDMTLRQEWFCSGSCYYETYPEDDEDEEPE